jgi:hypothetical protein
MKIFKPDSALIAMRQWIDAIALVLFLWLCSSVLIFIAGNYQGFSEQNYIFLLEFIRILGFSSGLVNLLAFGILLVWGLRHRCFMFVKSLATLISAAISFIFTFIVVVVHEFVAAT